MKLNQFCVFSIDTTLFVLAKHDLNQIYRATIDIKINNYTVYRKDRSDNSGYGGVAICVADHLLSQRRLEIEVQRLEYLCVEIKNNGKSILVGVCLMFEQLLLKFFET
jgi:hypothetical protein